jgi:hypothetical protein
MTVLTLLLHGSWRSFGALVKDAAALNCCHRLYMPKDFRWNNRHRWKGLLTVAFFSFTQAPETLYFVVSKSLGMGY